MQENYQPLKIEAEVQKKWLKEKSFEVTEDPTKEKYYCLSMFPYPSGKLHMGHVRNYTIGDVISRHQKMLGKNVLQPIGWDAFGLPAENAAIKNKQAPAKWTRENIDHMRDQLKRLGFAYDWSRELATCDKDYYHWEQWLFLQLWRKGLVYRKNSVVNWDPVDKTVLANEQVIDGKGWRSGATVEKKEIPQWFLKITDYAEQLLADIDKLNGWPEAVRTMQTNWIGRSIGLELSFKVDNSKDLTVFTTRPDTLMGVTFVAVAAEHPLALQISNNKPEIKQFITECRKLTTAEADFETMEKKGLNLGISAIHPISGQAVPIWVANFVLASYGSGAVMAVPAHDQRDYEFAKKYDIPIKPVIYPENSELDISEKAYEDKGILKNSGQFDGLNFKDAFNQIADYLENNNQGKRKVNYRLRDWGISRQRYWGCPIPIIFCDDCGEQAVKDDDLPVVLPENVKFSASGTSPIKTDPSFFSTSCPKCGKNATRETDTFDTFVESSWYYARYTCPNANKMLDQQANYWLPVDYYIGGVEHAILHLLYARFFHKLLRDQGLVQSDEPFTNLLTQGMVLKDGFKMSKSKGNTVDPENLIQKYGADTVRLFMMFASPPEQSLEWSDSGVEGSYKFLKRIWHLVYHNYQPCELSPSGKLEGKAQQLRNQIHQTLKKVSDDIARRHTFNTAIAAIMQLSNYMSRFSIDTEIDQAVFNEGLDLIVLMLSPMVPHICQQLWQEMGHQGMLVEQPWPEVDNTALVQQSQQIIVQVNGKLRARIEIEIDTGQTEVEKKALCEPNVQSHIKDKTIRKIIFVEGKLINIVV